MGDSSSRSGQLSSYSLYLSLTDPRELALNLTRLKDPDHHLSVHVPRVLVQVPAGQTDGVPPEVYDAARSGLTTACIDGVVATVVGENGFTSRFDLVHEPGTPLVVGHLRGPKRHKAYFDCWYMAGGALFAYHDPFEFISAKVGKETGLEIATDRWTIVGCYLNQTDARLGEEAVCAVLAPCFVTVVPFELISNAIQMDESHAGWDLFSRRDLAELEAREKTHPHPMHAWRYVLDAM